MRKGATISIATPLLIEMNEARSFTFDQYWNLRHNAPLLIFNSQKRSSNVTWNLQWEFEGCVRFSVADVFGVDYTTVGVSKSITMKQKQFGFSYRKSLRVLQLYYNLLLPYRQSQGVFQRNRFTTVNSHRYRWILTRLQLTK